MSGDRYISQNALIKEIAKIHGNLNTKNVGQAIWDTPTADVVEVRHGQWITRNVRGLEIEVKCSVCGSKDYYPAEYKNIRYPDYCSDCGAKMDGERRDA